MGSPPVLMRGFLLTAVKIKITSKLRPCTNHTSAFLVLRMSESRSFVAGVSSINMSRLHQTSQSKFSLNDLVCFSLSLSLRVHSCSGQFVHTAISHHVPQILKRPSISAVYHSFVGSPRFSGEYFNYHQMRVKFVSKSMVKQMKWSLTHYRYNYRLKKN